MIKKIMALCVVAAAAWAGYHFVWSGDDGPDKSAMALTVTRGKLEDVVTAQGKLEPREYVDVGAQVSGQIEKIHVDLGDVVQAGDLLAEIDPEIYEARVQADEARIKTLAAQIAQQQAAIDLARQQHGRNEKLITGKAISQDAFDASHTALRVAEAQMQALRAQMEEAKSTLDGDKASLGYTKIYAPMAGTVVVKSVREGQTLNASQQAPTLVQLANLDTMTVRAQVAEADVMRVRDGMDVYFTTLGAQGRRWQGTVRQILPSPEVINDVVLYNVLVDVNNEDRQLMTGMSTQMFFVLGSVDDALLLPVAGLGPRLADQDNETGQAYTVYVLNAQGGVDQKTVYAGMVNRNAAEVRQGLSEGDRVLPPSAAKPAPAAAGGGRIRGPRL